MLVAVLLALGASVSWAAANVAIQNSGRAVGPFRALLWAQVTSGSVLAIAAIVTDHPSAPFSFSVATWMLVAGLAALLAYVSLFFAFERGRLSITVPVMSSWSAIAAFVGIAMFGERPSSRQLIGAGLVFLGVVLVAIAEARASRSTLEGNRAKMALIASIGAALGFGLLVPAIDRLTPAFGALGAVPVAYGCEIALGLPLAFALSVDLTPPPVRRAGSVLLAGAAETIGFALLSLATLRAPVAIVSPLASLSASFTVLYAWIVLRERPAPLVAIGAALACLGVVALSR
jgi:drug/metabolite transporter (DMT)-like permease